MPPPDMATDLDDVAAVTTTAQFGAALQRLRQTAGCSLRDLERHTKSGRPPLARSTIADVEHGRVLPRPDWLTCYLTACNLPKRAQRSWLRARARLAVGPFLAAPGPLRWQRVADCDPRRLGVHPSITTTPNASDQATQARPSLPPMPLWVPRDVEDQVRDAIVAAAGQGGLVVLVGSSSTGKTRLAYQAILEEVGDWRLYQPADTAELAAVVANGQLPQGGWVVWLDELQHYLADGLTLAIVRALLDPARPMVLLATLWPSWFKHFTAPPSPPLTASSTSTPGEARDPVRDARQILTTIPTADAVIWLQDFSQAERRRARELAARDPRLAVALDDSQVGPTQVLAGAPQLAERWEHASDPYGRAVLTAAIDARRLGHLGPLPAALLKVAAPGYLTDQERATANRTTWFGHALAYATERLHGATAALPPVPGPGVGTIAGYTVADYLQQHGQARRRWISPPASLWDAAVAHVASAADRVRLANTAWDRHLHWHAVHLAVPAAEGGDPTAMRDLASWLEGGQCGAEAEGWRQRAAEAGDLHAMLRLAWLLEQAGQGAEAEGWYWRAAETAVKSRDAAAMQGLAEWLQRTGRGAEAEGWWRRAAETGDLDGMEGLAQWLERVGRGAEAEGWRQRAAETGDPRFMRGLAQELMLAGRGAEAESWYWRAIEAGDLVAMLLLAWWLEQVGRVAEVEQVWRRAAKTGNPTAVWEVVRRLEETGQEAEAEQVWLRAAETGDPDAMRSLAEWLHQAGRGAEAEGWYWQAAETGHPAAMEVLAWWLERTGRRAEAEGWWRRAAETGDLEAMKGLAKWLEEAGRGEEAKRLWRFGLKPGGDTAKPWDVPVPPGRLD